jgi:hypothetical protein
MLSISKMASAELIWPGLTLSRVYHKQGDQIGRIFATWAVVRCGENIKSCTTSQKIELPFSVT